MDIRIMSKKRGKIVNVSRLSLEAQGRYVVGLTEENNSILIEACENEKKAEEVIGEIIRYIEEGYRRGSKDMLIDIDGIVGR